MDSQKPGDLFDSYYYAHNCGAPYAHSEAWLNFFDRVAARLITDFNPKTVLDAGCAWGLLVERLRARGVEAWGIDISEFAIQQVDPSIKDYCFVGSIADPLPQKYDLIVSIEVLEHMSADVSVRSIENLCRHTNNIVLSTSPYDYKEATHLNVQPPDYWARQFARFGFYHDLDYEAGYITPWAVRFYRPEVESIQPVVQSYERKFWQIQTQMKDLRASVLEYHKKLQASEQAVRELKEQLAGRNEQEQIQALAAQLEEREQVLSAQLEEREKILARLREYEDRWTDLQKGRGWKMLQKIQSLRVSLFPPGSTRERWLDRFTKRS